MIMSPHYTAFNTPQSVAKFTSSTAQSILTHIILKQIPEMSHHFVYVSLCVSR